MNKAVCKHCCLNHRREEKAGFFDESHGWWDERSDEYLWKKKTIACPDIMVERYANVIPRGGIDLMLRDEFKGTAEEATMEDLLPPDWCHFYLEHIMIP